MLSLELDTAFRDCVVDGDSTPLFLISKAMTKLQAMFGLIPRVQVRGAGAQGPAGAFPAEASSGVLTVVGHWRIRQELSQLDALS